MSAGETVTCTFTNRKRGQIVVVKDASPTTRRTSRSRPAAAVAGELPARRRRDGTLSNTRTFDDVVPGGRLLALGDRAGRLGPDRRDVQRRQPGVEHRRGAGETVTCTFTNRKRGQITVVKDAVPDDPQDFAFTAGGGLSPASFSLDDDLDRDASNTRTFKDVPAGSGYSLSETVPSGWDQTSATCDDGSPVSNIAVGRGET